MNITDAELARLEELADEATPRPWIMAKDCDESDHMEVTDEKGVVCCTDLYGFEYPEQWDNGRYISAACNAVPSLVAEVRALRRYSQMMRSGNKVVRDDLESENASLRGQVEALQKMVEWLARECADGTNDCPYLTWYRDWIPPTRHEWCSCTDTKEGGFDCTKDAKECWLKAARDSIVEES